jgi:NAD-dependent DNA ligase
MTTPRHPGHHRRALATHRVWPDSCPVCDRFLTRRATAHRRRCTARAHAAAQPFGRCA